MSLSLLMIIIYGYSIAMTQITKPEEDLNDEYFSSVAHTVGTLFLVGVLPDQFDIVTATGSSSWLGAAVLLTCLMLTALTGVNMMAGVLVEVVRAVSMVEKERMDLTFVKETLFNVLREEC